MGDVIAVVVLVGSLFWVFAYAVTRWSDIWPNNRR
jgi:hypothetical protein